MTRILTTVLLCLLGIVVIGVLALGSTGRGTLATSLKETLLEHSDAGRGFQDGQLVWRQEQPVRITIEQLPSLEGRLRGTRYQGQFVSSRLSWYGVSLREAIGQCLEISPARVEGDASLDGIWLDVDLGRIQSAFESRFKDWGESKAAVLDALEQSYGLAVTTEQRMAEVDVLVAGPGWAAHANPAGDDRDGDMSGDDSHLRVVSTRAQVFVNHLRGTLGFEDVEGIDLDQQVDIDLQWDPSDPDDHRRQVAEQLDLTIVTRMRERLFASVEGVATPPQHIRAEVDPPRAEAETTDAPEDR